MYVERTISSEFERMLSLFRMIAIVGPRQSGKTTFLQNRPQENKDYLLFDDPDIKNLFDRDIKKFEAQYLSKDKFLILDEIQSAEDAGRKLKYLVDTGYKLWITSSSELILSEKVLSYLVGRISILRIYPFNIQEFLRAKNFKVDEQKIINRYIDEHIRYGGYPRVVLTEDIQSKKDLLRNLRETIILKDVAHNFKIDDITNLEKLIEYLAFNISSIVSYDTISKTLRISFPTLRKYLDALEKTYIISHVRPFFRNRTKELSKQPKVFFIDNGILNLTTKDFSVSGKNFENYVFTELLKAGFTPKFWRNKQKNEVDFIVEREREIIPIEVKLNFHKVESGLKTFIKEYSPKESYIAIYDGEEENINLNGCELKVRFVNNIIKELKP
ncbi:MAG: ATP-binding protein [Ignavibacteria bacterium]|nr:ATP-binding protein [Ignavibacteria bacterium]